MPATSHIPGPIARPSKAPHHPRALDTVNRIMDAARDALLAGPHETPPIAEVARRGGVTRSTIYRYFPSTEAIRDALFRRYITRRVEEYRAMLETLPEDASAEEICATTIMAALRAGSTQPVGPLHQRLLAALMAQARRNGRPFVRAVSAEMFLCLQQRGLLHHGQPSAELILATGMAIAEGFEYAIVEQPQLLTDAGTARQFTAWMHQSLFPQQAALATAEAPPEPPPEAQPPAPGASPQ